MEPIQTKNLMIVPLTDDELRIAIAYESNAHRKQALLAMLASCETISIERLWYTNWRITHCKSDRIVGSLGFKGPPENGVVEIGYSIFPFYENSNYATEAAKALTDWAFEHAEVCAVTSKAEPDNADSQQFLKNLGFLPAGQGEAGTLFEKKRTYPNKYNWLDEYLLSKPGVTKDYKVEWAWWRYQVGGRLFAALVHPPSKYAVEYADKDLISLKCEPLMAELLRKMHPEILPGFYTDKINWNSIYLGGELSESLMREMCDNSYQLIFARLTKKLQREILGE